MSQSKIDAAAVQAALADVKDPETGRSIQQSKQLRDVRVDGNAVELTLALTTHSAILWPEVEATVEEQLKTKIAGLQTVTIRREVHDRPPPKQGQIGLTAKSIIAVGSGKGGVGKSSVAACLALTLHAAGSKVGLMDADVYGPSIPHLTGTGEHRVAAVENKLQPIEKNGMPIMSIGYLVPPDQAVIWRGPMLHGAVTQFLRDTAWGPLDYLIVDMPPGTGDVAISLSQSLPLTGAIVVCTPQEVALLDAVKAIYMFRKVNIPVLGMVENMSGFLCPECGKRYDIFGSGGARQRAEQLQVPFLGEIPLTIALRERGDAGQTDENLSDPQLAPYLQKIGLTLVRNLARSAAQQPVQPSLPVL